MITKKRQRGFTLVELMIGLMIGLLLLAGVVTLFTQTRASAQQNELIAGMQDNARFALSILANDIRSAGFTGGVLNLAEVATDDSTLVNITNDCGTSSQPRWGYNLTSYGGPVQSISEKSAADAAAAHQCLSSDDLPPTSDVLTIKRTLGDPKSGSLTAQRIYLRSNGEIGCLWYYDGSSTPSSSGCPTGTTQDWAYVTHVYYIKNGTVPELCRFALTGSSAGPRMENQCLAQGIEYFHIDWGIDTDSPADGIVDAYTGTPPDMSRVVAARIYILSRSTEALPAKSAIQKEFRLGTANTITHNDRFYRRVYSTTVLLRNTVNRANLL